MDLVHEIGRGDAEAHHVHQAVELGAEAGAGVGQAGDAPVEGVEYPGEDEEPAGAIELTFRRERDRPDPEEQVEQREQARDDDDDASHAAPRLGRGGRHGAYSASTVAPAATRSPTCTREAGRAVRGR